MRSQTVKQQIINILNKETDINFKRFKKIIYEKLNLNIFVTSKDTQHHYPHLHIDDTDFEYILKLPDLEIIEGMEHITKKVKILIEILSLYPDLTEKIVFLFCRRNPDKLLCKKIFNQND